MLRCLLKKLFRWVVLLVVSAVTLTVLIAAVISHQGRKRLAEVKTELIGKGEKLTISELLPTPISDHLNILEDPVWRPAEPAISSVANRLEETPLALADTPLTATELAEGKTLFGSEGFSPAPAMKRLDAGRGAIIACHPNLLNEEQARWILKILGPFDSLIERIELLVDRPFAQFHQNHDIMSSEVYEFGGGLSYVAKVLKPRASAYIALDRGEQSLSDINTLGRLVAATEAESMLYMEMLRLYLACCIDELLREGIRKQIWSEGQLLRLDAILQQVDLIHGMANAFRAERGIQNQYLEEVHLGQRRIEREHLPGFFREHPFGPLLWRAYLHVSAPSAQASFNRDVQTLVELLDNAEKNGIDHETVEKVIAPKGTGFLRDTFFHMLGGNVHIAIEAQTAVDQARIACALERYRLRRGSYPPELSLLVPEFLPRLPPDRSSLTLMKYRRIGSDRFELTARSGEQIQRWSNFPSE